MVLYVQRMENETLIRTRTKTGFQTCAQFEMAIAWEVTDMFNARGTRRVESLTVRGLEIAQNWIAQRMGNNHVRKVKKLETLRAMAWNLAECAEVRLQDGSKAW
jgi:hypothetical protein